MTLHRRRAHLFSWTLLAVATTAFILVPFALWEQSIFELSRSWLSATSRRVALFAVVVALLAADLALPVPSSFVAAAAVAALGPVAGALSVWTGMSVGAVVGYFLGRLGGTPLALRVVGASELERAERILARFGAWILIVCRGVPVLAEASTLLAGTARMPFARFAFFTFGANFGLALAYAALSQVSDTGLLGALVPFALGIGVPLLALAIQKTLERRTDARAPRR